MADGRPPRFSFSIALHELLQQGDACRQALNDIERTVLTSVLAAKKGNDFQAASTLGMSRATLRKKLGTLGIELMPINFLDHE